MLLLLWRKEKSAHEYKVVRRYRNTISPIGNYGGQKPVMGRDGRLVECYLLQKGRNMHWDYCGITVWDIDENGFRGAFKEILDSLGEGVRVTTVKEALI